MAEWFKAYAWKACVATAHRGFESLSLRQLPLPDRSAKRHSCQRPVLRCIASTVSRGFAVQDVTHGLRQLLRMIRLLQKCGCFAQSESGPFRIHAVTAAVN